MPKIYACAKLNLCLAVTGKFADGYHAVDMVMQEITLSDVVVVEKGAGIKVSCTDVCPPEKNSAYRAAEVFFKYTGAVGGAHIEIEKRIPAEAGLGGASTDAAAVLYALNNIYGTKLDADALHYMAAQVGMDTPFFIYHGCMRARGKGELLTRVENRLAPVYVIIKPEGGVSTPLCYAKYDDAPSPPVNTHACIDALEAGDRPEYFKYAKNALYDAACSLCPEIGAAIDDAYSTGASFAMMTGSGSAVFAVYHDKDARKTALKSLSAKYPFVAEAENY